MEWLDIGARRPVSASSSSTRGSAPISTACFGCRSCLFSSPRRASQSRKVSSHGGSSGRRPGEIVMTRLLHLNPNTTQTVADLMMRGGDGKAIQRRAIEYWRAKRDVGHVRIVHECPLHSGESTPIAATRSICIRGTEGRPRRVAPHRNPRFADDAVFGAFLIVHHEIQRERAPPGHLGTGGVWPSPIRIGFPDLL